MDVATPPFPPATTASPHRCQCIFIKFLQNRIQNSGINNCYKGKLQFSCIRSPGTSSKVLGFMVSSFFFSLFSWFFIFFVVFLAGFFAPVSVSGCSQPPSRGRGCTNQQCVNETLVNPALAVFFHCKVEKVSPVLIKTKLASQ